ncbi:uncharacterized protein MCYG_00889 [Microsporum canis CBS 113480]|uniref:Uncharacterized protein n=1 Tax=Arthroderma otae (strain ATCC MYA-4605 / CBS 113480) TaxID=554155 RepID=C5FDW7_ARTOC|nr:uncharacterized protein MCYG_00889 [Microsporum canis CBS 113480]EEQ28001.1 predicted protein [Microsporum canis CBS 113480]
MQTVRDLSTKASSYVKRVESAIAFLDALYPLDSPGKVEQALPLLESAIRRLWLFTTLDTDLESAVIRQLQKFDIVSGVGRATVACEATFELYIANKVMAATDKAKGRQHHA